MLNIHSLFGTDTLQDFRQCIPCSCSFFQDKTGKKTHSSTSEIWENFNSVYKKNRDIPADELLM